MPLLPLRGSSVSGIYIIFLFLSILPTPARKNIVTHFVTFFNATTNYKKIIAEEYFIISLCPHCWGTGLPYGLHIRRTKHTHHAGPVRVGGAQDKKITEELKIKNFGHPSND
jgi:hypothetical protein